LGVNITGDSGNQTVTVAGRTVTGTYALGTGTDVISTTNGANLTGVNSGAATTAETLNFVGGVTMTAAQLNGFTSLVGTTSPSITLTTAITAAMLDDAVIDSTTDISIVLADVASNAITADADTLGTSGDVLTIDASNLTGTNALTFIGAAETTGKFIVKGGAAADAITAGSGGDVITGNGGADSITLGAGIDKVVILALTNGADTVVDFTIAEDIIEIGGALKTALRSDTAQVDGDVTANTNTGATYAIETAAFGVVTAANNGTLSSADLTATGYSAVATSIEGAFVFGDAAADTANVEIFAVESDEGTFGLYAWTQSSATDVTVAGTELTLLGVFTADTTITSTELTIAA